MKYTVPETKKAFSLIELLVVLAVVGILASISIPTYRLYSLRTKLGTVAETLGDLRKMGWTYWNKTGRMPNAYNLGLSPTTNATAASSPSSINPYLSSLNFGAQGTPQFSACDGSGAIWGTFNTTALGMPSTYATAGGFTCYYFNRSKIMLHNCSFYFNAGSVYTTDNLIPGWLTCQDTSCSNSMYHQQKDGYGNTLGFTACNCA